MWSDDNRERLNEADFGIEITSQCVNVRLNASLKSPHGRFYWAFFFVVMWIAALCFMLFSGSHGAPGMWHGFATYPINSAGFVVPLFLLVGSAVFMILLSWRHVVMGNPSDETFYCDRSTLTISRVRWLDIHNRDWRTRSFPLHEITGIRYQAVARTRGHHVYGLRFSAAGKSFRILPGLGTLDAGRILESIKGFGASVNE